MNRQEEIDDFTKQCLEDFENYDVDIFQIVSIGNGDVICKTKNEVLFTLYENVQGNSVCCRFNGYNQHGQPVLCRLDS